MTEAKRPYHIKRIDLLLAVFTKHESDILAKEKEFGAIGLKKDISLSAEETAWIISALEVCLREASK